MYKKYRQKTDKQSFIPERIEALKATGDNWLEIRMFGAGKVDAVVTACDDTLIAKGAQYCCVAVGKSGNKYLKMITKGNYLIKDGVDLFPCTSVFFKANYLIT